MSQTKRYTLPIDLLDALELKAQGNRSLALRQAIDNANDTLIVNVLQHRLRHGRTAQRSAAVTVLIDEKHIEKLGDLSQRCDLPIERVLGMIIEGYIHDLKSHKESHGTAGRLQPAAEAGTHA